MPTTVICVRGRDRKALLADSGFCYVGRQCAGWPNSHFGNPYKVVGHITRPLDTPYLCSTAEEAVAKYAAWIARKTILIERLTGLRGRRLGCWCGDWRPGEPEIPCHAVILAKLADGPEGDRP
jgi:hypothetical protein